MEISTQSDGCRTDADSDNSDQIPGPFPSIEEVLLLFESFAARLGKLDTALTVRRGLETSRIIN